MKKRKRLRDVDVGEFILNCQKFATKVHKECEVDLKKRIAKKDAQDVMMICADCGRELTIEEKEIVIANRLEGYDIKDDDIICFEGLNAEGEVNCQEQRKEKRRDEFDSPNNYGVM